MLLNHTKGRCQCVVFLIPPVELGYKLQLETPSERDNKEIRCLLFNYKLTTRYRSVMLLIICAPLLLQLPCCNCTQTTRTRAGTHARI